MTPKDSHLWMQAEEFVAWWLRAHGFPDACVVSGGADGGVDVEGLDVTAQVKHWCARVGRPEVQRLVGAAGATGKQLAFFSANGYSEPARVYATEHSVSLYTFDLASRTVRAETSIGLSATGRSGLSEPVPVWQQLIDIENRRPKPLTPRAITMRDQGIELAAHAGGIEVRRLVIEGQQAIWSGDGPIPWEAIDALVFEQHGTRTNDRSLMVRSGAVWTPLVPWRHGTAASWERFAQRVAELSGGRVHLTL